MFLYPSPHSLGVKYLNVEFRRECCCRFQTITCFLCVGRDKLFRDGFVVTDIGFFSSDLRIPFSVQYCATSLGPTKKSGYFSARSFDILSGCLAIVASLRWRVAVMPMTFRMRQTSAMTDSR